MAAWGVGVGSASPADYRNPSFLPSTPTSNFSPNNTPYYNTRSRSNSSSAQGRGQTIATSPSAHTAWDSSLTRSQRSGVEAALRSHDEAYGNSAYTSATPAQQRAKHQQQQRLYSPAPAAYSHSSRPGSPAGRTRSRAGSTSSAGHSAGYHSATSTTHLNGGSADRQVYANAPVPRSASSGQLYTARSATVAAGDRDRWTPSPAPDLGPPTPRSRIPTRPRAFSASAVSINNNVQETLIDHNAPPVPALPSPSPTSSTSSHTSLTSPTHPSQSFPGASQMSLSSHAPDPPHRLGLGTQPVHAHTSSSSSSTVPSPSGIPVLKSRARSMIRSPSPDLPTSQNLGLNEPPPFRVDLDAALAEIEDELEVRAIQKFASARPNPTTPRSVNGLPAPQRRKSTTTPNTRVTPAANRRKSQSKQNTPIPRSNSTPRNTVAPRTPRTPRESTPSKAARETPKGPPAAGRKRHASDVAQSGSVNSRQRRTSIQTPKNARNIRAQTASPPGSLNPASRLGPAAHWVPPETAFTPPKGADWDDVVLPAVAKKLAMAGATRDPGSDGSGDDDLAVEWDTDGTPIRWEKRAGRNGMSGMDFSVSRDDYDDDEYNDDFGPGYDSILDDYGSGSKPVEMRPVRASASQATELDERFSQPQQPPQSQRPQHPPHQQQFPPQEKNYPPSELTQPRPAPAPPTFPPAPQQQANVGKAKGKGKKGKGGDDDIKSAGCGCVLM